MIDEIIVKNSDDIGLIKKTREETSIAIQILEQKIDKINDEMEMTRKNIKDKEEKERSHTPMKCNLCGKSYKRFIDLETHIMTNHEKYDVFPCDKCEKVFVVKWRLKKHMQLHSENFAQHCHYFNNGKECPFEAIGCKFLHSVSQLCQFGLTCTKRLCPNRHSGDTKNITETGQKCYESSEQEEMDTSAEECGSFLTSTPVKRKFRCVDCDKKSQCTDCFVRQHMVTGKIAI